MDKQKKQILILVVVLILGGGVVVWVNSKTLFGESAPAAPAPGADPNAAAGAPGAPAPGAPAAAPGAPGTPGAAAAPVAVKDLPMPALTQPDSTTVSVSPKAFDPLFVKDPDVAYQKVADDIKKLKEGWHLVGIAEAGTEDVKVTTYVKNEQGVNVPTVAQSTRTVWACFFKDNPRFYREGDRLENTYFKVKRIVFRPEGAFIEVEGDTGAVVKLLIMQEDRYGGGGK